MTELHREFNRIHSEQTQQNQPVRSEKLALQQHLQNKLQQQHLTQQLQQVQQQQNNELTIQQINTKANLAAILQTQSDSMKILDATTLTAVKNKKNKNKNGQNPTSVHVPTAFVLNLAKPTKLNGSILSAIVAQAQNQQHLTCPGEKKSAHKHDEAAKLLKVKKV